MQNFILRSFEFSVPKFPIYSLIQMPFILIEIHSPLLVITIPTVTVLFFIIGKSISNTHNSLCRHSH